MNGQWIRIVAAVTLTAGSLYWFYEASTCGFCGFSRYGAPFIVLGNLSLLLFARRKSAKRK